MAPLFGLLSILCGLWFVLGMPIMAAVFAVEYRRSGKMNTGLVVVVVMLVGFYIIAGLIWRLGSTDWHLSFLTTLEASVNSEEYGHAVEHRAETMVAWLLMLSTLTALFAGAAAAQIYRGIRRRHPDW